MEGEEKGGIINKEVELKYKERERKTKTKNSGMEVLRAKKYFLRIFHYLLIIVYVEIDTWIRSYWQA